MNTIEEIRDEHAKGIHSLFNACMFKSECCEREEEIALLRKDADRYRWIRNRLAGFDFDWQDSGESVVAFVWPNNVPIGGNSDMNIDAAMLKTPSA